MVRYSRIFGLMLGSIMLVIAVYPISAMAEPSTSALQLAITNQSPIQVISLHSSRSSDVYVVAFSPDGKWIAAASHDGVTLLDSQTRARVWFTPITALTGSEASVRNLVFAPDSMTIAAVVSVPSTTVLIDVSTGSIIRTLVTADENSVFGYALGWSPDGTMLATGTDSGAVRVWQVADGTVLQTLIGHRGSITGLQFSGDGAILTSVDPGGLVAIPTASGTADGFFRMSARIWRVSDGQLLSIVQGTGLPYKATAFAGGTMVVALTKTGNPRVWGIVGQNMEFVRDFALPGLAGGYTSLALTPDEAILITGVGHDIFCWRMTDGTLLQQFREPQGQVESVAISPDGKTVLSVSEYGELSVWSLDSTS